jgi:hypothetical protein
MNKKNKFKYIAIVFLLSCLIFLACSEKRVPVEKRITEIDPYLSEFFGGLDLGMDADDIHGINRGIKPINDSGLNYSGHSANNPMLDIDVSFDNSVIAFFKPDGKSETMTAFLDTSYVYSVKPKSLEYFVADFKRHLNQVPQHFIGATTSGSGNEFYKWEFETYNFEVIFREWHNGNYPEREVLFSVYRKYINMEKPENWEELREISDVADTINAVNK